MNFNGFLLDDKQREKSERENKHISDASGWLTDRPVYSKRVTTDCRVQGACGSTS